MHSANFTALSRAVSFLLRRCWRCRCCWRCRSRRAVPVRADQPFSATVATARADQRRPMARAASGRTGFCSSMRALTAASLDRASGRRTWEGSRERWLRGAVRSARARCRRSGTARTRRRARTATPRHRRARCRPRPPTREQTCSGVATQRAASASGAVLRDRLTEQLLLVLRGTPAAVDDELDPVVRGIGRGLAQGTDQIWIELGHTRNLVVEDRRAVGDGTVGLAERATVLTAADLGARLRARRWARRPPRTRTPATGRRGLRRSPR